MGAWMRMCGRFWPLGLAAGLTLACDGGDVTGPGEEGGPVTGQSSIVGRIEGGSASSGVVALHSGITVAAARVRSDGGLQGLATASAAVDGSYRIDGVPAGIDRLVVVATSETGEELGRVVVHQALSVGGVAIAAPMNGETTVEAHVFSELVRMGMPTQAVNTVELAQAIEFSGEATADAVVASTPALRELAEGFTAYQDIYTQVLAQLGIPFDPGARFQAGLPSAVAYAQDRHNGADEDAASERAARSLADAYRSAGADYEEQVQASSAGETGLIRAAEVADPNARLDIARAALEVNLLVRERLIMEALNSLGVPAVEIEAVRQGLAQAQSAIEGAQSFEGLEQALAQASAQGQSALETYLVQSGRIPSVAQERMQQAFQSLPSQLDLESGLATAATASAVAETYVSFFADLRNAVFSAVTELVQLGGNVNGEAVADVFTGLRGFVSLP